MPRPCKCRLIGQQPPASGFKPVGMPGRHLDQIEVGLDELEALRLADLEGLYHDAAAEQMRVSRPTFGRLIARARHKVACALLQSKMLVFKGGPVEMKTMRVFECAECGTRFEAPYGGGRPGECPGCHGVHFHRAAEDRGPGLVGAGDAGVDRGRAGGPGRGRCRRRRAGWHDVGGYGMGGGGGVFRIVEPSESPADAPPTEGPSDATVEGTAEEQP